MTPDKPLGARKEVSLRDAWRGVPVLFLGFAVFLWLFGFVANQYYPDRTFSQYCRDSVGAVNHLAYRFTH